MRNYKSFFKITNSVITINLEKDAVSYINSRNNLGEIRKIHIFVTDPERINTKTLSVFGDYGRRNHIKVIVHCFNKKDRYFLRKRLKGVKKDNWFHFSIVKRDTSFSLSREASLTVSENKATIAYPRMILEYKFIN